MSKIIMCPGCGLNLPSAEEQLDERYNASYACRQLYGELSAYTLSLRDVDFIHQLGVDTYAAQHAGANIKPIAITASTTSDCHRSRVCVLLTSTEIGKPDKLEQ
jgi:hypothetical protein